MVSTPCWDTPGPAPSTPASRTVSALSPARPTGLYPAPEVGLGAVADQSEHQFTASVILRPAVRKRQAVRQQLGGAANAILGNWEVNVIERVISGFPLFVVDSANGSGVNFQWNGNSLNRPNQVGDPNKAGPVAAKPWCTHPPRSIRWKTGSILAHSQQRRPGNWERSARSLLRAAFREHGFLRHQELPLILPGRHDDCSSALSSSTSSTIPSSI